VAAGITLRSVVRAIVLARSTGSLAGAIYCIVVGVADFMAGYRPGRERQKGKQRRYGLCRMGGGNGSKKYQVKWAKCFFACVTIETATCSSVCCWITW
jgi:hypothetical protein